MFALWTVRQDAPALPDLVSFFHLILEMGREHIPAIVEEALRSIDWTCLELQEYLTGNIRYTLGSLEEKSLDLFFEKAVPQGTAFLVLCRQFPWGIKGGGGAPG